MQQNFNVWVQLSHENKSGEVKIKYIQEIHIQIPYIKGLDFSSFTHETSPIEVDGTIYLAKYNTSLITTTELGFKACVYIIFIMGYSARQKYILLKKPTRPHIMQRLVHMFNFRQVFAGLSESLFEDKMQLKSLEKDGRVSGGMGQQLIF